MKMSVYIAHYYFKCDSVDIYLKVFFCIVIVNSSAYVYVIYIYIYTYICICSCHAIFYCAQSHGFKVPHFIFLFREG